MPKKLSVEVEDETYKQLSDLSANYGLSINQAVDTILKMVASNKGNIERLSEISGPNKNLGCSLYTALSNYLTIASLFKNVLGKVKAEGQFEVDIANVEINWEDEYFRFRFDAATKDYSVDSIEVMKEDGSYNLSTNTGIRLDDTKANSFDDLKAVVESMGNPFEVDECRIHLDDGEDFCDLVIDCWDESIEYLPTVKQVDRVIKKILKKAKIRPETGN